MPKMLIKMPTKCKNMKITENDHKNVDDFA